MTRLDAELLRRAQVPETDLAAVVAAEPNPVLFATVSGAHLYGFPSQDSDVDMRGVHLLPAADLVGLREPEETRSRMWWQKGGEQTSSVGPSVATEPVEMDLVTHDLRKFVRLLLRRNGYVLEQLLSPLVVHTGDVHAELAALAPGTLTRHHAHHYRGFARTQWRLYESTGELKPLLYTFRALLTGTMLMRGGGVNAHLPTLVAELPEAPGYLPELVEAKSAHEHAPAGTGPAEVAGAAGDVERLHSVLEEAQAASVLPDTPTGHDALHELVVRVRLGNPWNLGNSRAAEVS